MTRPIFDDRITEERARQIMRERGFKTAEEKALLARQEAANREPAPYTPTPEELKQERADNLARRLLMAGKDRGWR